MKSWADAGGGAGGIEGQVYRVRGSSQMPSFRLPQVVDHQPYARPDPVVT